MSFWLWGAIFAWAGGFLICLVNFILSKIILAKKPDFFAASTIARQILNIGYLVLLYFIAPLTPWDVIYLLVGGALGITLPMIYFTAKLLKMSNGLKKQQTKKETADTKEEKTDG